MSRRWLLVLGLCWAVGTGQAAGEALPTVIVLSWDGLRHDYLELHGADGGLPALSRMAADGARAERMTPVFPSNTFPGHVSMATGTFPDVHGIEGFAVKRHRFVPLPGAGAAILYRAGGITVGVAVHRPHDTDAVKRGPGGRLLRHNVSSTRR